MINKLGMFHRLISPSIRPLNIPRRIAPNLISKYYSTKSTPSFHLGHIDSFKKGATTECRVEDHSILVSTDTRGTMKAVWNVCRHRGAPLLTTGETIEGNQLTCPYHGISSKTLSKKDFISLPKLRIENEQVFLDLSLPPEEDHVLDYTHPSFYKNIDGPIPDATPINPKAYTCPHFFNTSLEKIFKTQWINIGTLSSLREKEETQIQIGTISLCVRAKNNSITAQHAESSELPQPPVRAQIYGTQAFVCLDETTPDIDTYFNDLEDHISDYHLSNWELQRESTLSVQANWLLLMENFIDAYHVPYIHPEYAKMVPGTRTSLNAPITEESRFIGFYSKKLASHHKNRPFLGLINIPSPRKSEIKYPGLFIAHIPNSFYFLFETHQFVVSILPQTHTQSIETVSLLTEPNLKNASGLSDSDFDAYVKATWDFLIQVNQEDLDICTQVQKGVSSPGYKGGQFVKKDFLIQKFHQIMATHMCR